MPNNSTLFGSGPTKHGDNYDLSMNRIIQDMVTNLTHREENSIQAKLRELAGSACLSVPIPTGKLTVQAPIGIMHNKLKIQVTAETQSKIVKLYTQIDAIPHYVFIKCPDAFKADFDFLTEKHHQLWKFKRDFAEYLRHYYVTTRKLGTNDKYGKLYDSATANIIKWTPEVLHNYLPFTDVWGVTGSPTFKQIMEEDDNIKNQWGHIEDYIHYLHGMNLFCK